MPAIKIPKLARNKYNYVQGADGRQYVTQTQLMMSSGGGGGGTGGGNNPSSHVTASINQAMYDKGILTYDDIKTINGYSLIGYGDIVVGSEGVVDLSAYMTKQEMTAYVSKDDLNNASYLNQSYLNDAMNNYPTFSNVDAMLNSYVTKNELNQAGYTSIVQTTYNDYKNMSYAEKNNGDLYIITDYDYTYNLITDEDLAYASYATTSYVENACKAVKDSCYAYTDSKVTYNDVVSIVNNIITAMKSSGDLVDASYVVSKVNGN